MICAAIFVELERPEQLSRFAAKDDLQMEVERLHRNLTYMLQGINFHENEPLRRLVKYSMPSMNLPTLKTRFRGICSPEQPLSTPFRQRQIQLQFPGRNRMRQQLKNLEPHSITEDLQDDKRFHPSIIGVILLVFMASVAAFISYMEDITYFNSVYACFITYSTSDSGISISTHLLPLELVQFNDLRNCVHIAGYVILSAWVSSILDKCGIRRHR
ncbi:hypothetical protein TCAL_17075 [Tigriopus californicus]|uniref:Potassium channel domain-containing protein n=1 Tax=Tigriopus californicus TaxID=6832 RepID=A0A553PQB1_TIGCA|nr:hypothetical protein TCAL_17075 [Tigriopus californicus]